jgi:hypothetical protein
VRSHDEAELVRIGIEHAKKAHDMDVTEKEAKEMMRLTGADFLITGEVLGQRPMSQRRDTFPVIDREADVVGYVLRPLSSKLMKPTIPEEIGIVNRELLYDFAGRSRKPQMALAKEFGLIDYAAPAGGCLLTDPVYSYRLRTPTLPKS